MKYYVPFLSLILISSCSHINHTTSTASMGAERSIAQTRRITEEFFYSAFKAQDNIVYKSANEIEGKLLREVKANPNKFGLTDAAAKDLKKLDDIKNERIMAEILSEAPSILKFTPKMKKASVAAIMDQGGLASHIKIKSVDVSTIKLELHEQTGLGRDVSLRIKNLKKTLVDRNLASEKQAQKIYDNLFQAAKELSTNAKGKPAELLLARQIVDYSTAISEKTGKQFLGKGGCMKINGRAVLENKADIAFKTLNDVDAKHLSSYDEIGEALQKNHGEVTNRTKRESCLAVEALTIGKSCGGVYSPNLAPKGC